MNIAGLACPLTKQPLHEVGRGETAHLTFAPSNPIVDLGQTDRFLLTQDGKTAYPIKDGVPVLLSPEALSTDAAWIRDLKLPQYAEAYKEMDFYNAIGTQRAEQICKSGCIIDPDSGEAMKHLFSIAKLPESKRANFPYPVQLWLCATLDVASQRDCNIYIGSVKGKRIMQVGGDGISALLLLLAGAAEAILLTPMLGETRVAQSLASILGLSNHLRCVVGVGEELPFQADYIDVCTASGCVHHMRTDIAFKEMSRTLKCGGRLVAVEPWRAPGYTLGTKLFGKREPNFFCSPLTGKRVAPLYSSFSSAQCVQHGSLTRYPSIVAAKAGAHLSIPMAARIASIDDAICNCIPYARKMGSGVALLATK